MIRGRPPKAAHLKLVTGNPGDRPIRRSIAVKSEGVSAPSHLSPTAKAEWKRASRKLAAAGLLTGLDRAALTAYCTCWAEWRRADEIITGLAAKDAAFGGLLMKAKSGTVIVNPLVYVRDRARSDCIKYAAQFGMTPMARTRVDPAPPPPADSAAAEFGL